jgi:hypothetical protein
MNRNSKNDTTHKSEINDTMVFTQLLPPSVKRQTSDVKGMVDNS